MRGVRAKDLRRVVYGDEGSSRARQWSSEAKPHRWAPNVTNRLGAVIGTAFRRLWVGRVVADAQRRAYQAAKRVRRGVSWKAVSALAPRGERMEIQ